MKKFTTSHIKAEYVETDDRFKMGGAYYRVMQNSENSYGDRVIRFYPAYQSGPLTTVSTMIVEKTMNFKIYNQKPQKK
jgi:hypothetical protein